jgi:hypothetical protein
MTKEQTTIIAHSRKMGAPVPMPTVELEPGESAQHHCVCCGGVTQTVWGYIYVEGGARAVYYATWTREHPERGFEVAISIGGWGEGADPRNKRLVVLEGRFLETGLTFCVRDAAGSRWAAHSLLGQPLAREDVISTPLAAELFHLVDHLVVDDPRVREFTVSERAAVPEADGSGANSEGSAPR